MNQTQNIQNQLIDIVVFTVGLIETIKASPRTSGTFQIPRMVQSESAGRKKWEIDSSPVFVQNFARPRISS